jgi:hypothetical protein
MADWRFKYRYRNVPMLELVLQPQGRPAVKLDGVVDSGATHTFLSLQTAEVLGLEGSELVETPPATVADDTKVPSWFTKVPIRAQVQAELSPNAPLEPWGPIFDIYPRFMKSGIPLWGQEDLGASFEIRQQRFLLPAYFVLEYWAGMSEGAPRS